jgi:Tol biopolymer transport system component
MAVMNADGTNVRVVPALTNQGLAYAHAGWLADGRVLFLSDRAGTPSPYLMSADTTGISRVTTGAFRDDVPRRVP